MTPNKKNLTYKDSGVDISAADDAKNRIAKLAKSTFNLNVLTEIGSFGGIYAVPGDDENALVASADGVGTKLMIATKMNRLNTVGIDLINHCVNDISVMGAKPMFFLDYIGHSDFTPVNIADVVEGLSTACKKNNMALIGGETAQMPGIYPNGHFDLVGFIVGFIKRANIITGEKIEDGDIVIGLGSSGLHTNGYSLARKVFENTPLDKTYNGVTLGDLLLEPHISYLNEVTALINNFDVRGMAHITGGGLKGNLNRVLPNNLDAEILRNTAPRPEIFKIIHSMGVAEDEMFHAFNMGFGYLFVLPKTDAENALEYLKKNSPNKSFMAGRIVKGTGKVNLL